VLATVFGRPPGAGRVPIGHAVPHTRVYVLDRGLEHASVGMRGEIHLAGDGLAPATTAVRRRRRRSSSRDPYGPPGSRCTAPGDVGRYLADGAIDILGAPTAR